MCNADQIRKLQRFEEERELGLEEQLQQEQLEQERLQQEQLEQEEVRPRSVGVAMIPTHAQP